MEYWDIFKDGKLIGVKRKDEPLEEGQYHRYVDAWMEVEEDLFLIQRRSLRKHLYPGWWSCSVSGAVHAGERPLEGVLREIKEELSLHVEPKNVVLYQKIREGQGLFYIYYIYQELGDQKIRLQEEEVMEVDMVSRERIFSLVEEKKLVKLDYYPSFFRWVDSLKGR